MGKAALKKSHNCCLRSKFKCYTGPRHGDNTRREEILSSQCFGLNSEPVVTRVAAEPKDFVHLDLVETDLSNRQVAKLLLNSLFCDPRDRRQDHPGLGHHILHQGVDVGGVRLIQRDVRYAPSFAHLLHCYYLGILLSCPIYLPLGTAAGLRPVEG